MLKIDNIIPSEDIERILTKDFFGVVYCLMNTINNKKYFGQTTKDLEKYLNRHRRSAENGSDRIIHRAIRKYGWDKFSKEIICYCGDKLSLGLIEDFCINTCNTIVPNGYNLKGGGYYGKYSKQTKQKISDNHADVSGKNNPMYGIHRYGENAPMHGKKHSPETIQKMREKKIGENNPMYGKTKENNPMFGIHRYGKDNPMFGKKHSTKTIQKMRENNSGENNPMFGKKHLPETIQKMKDSQRKRRIQEKEEKNEKIKNDVMKS